MAKEMDSMSHHPSGKPHVTSARHDLLYSKARYVLNQRHIKRPWFNLNPFLEKLDETINLDNYLPEESKYIQRLESLVICESFSSHRPVDTRELALEKFFEYLFSGEWEKGCSIRVLEGQLLEQLLVSLYRLEREKQAVRHTTYAVAKNDRKIAGCYKQAEQEAKALKKETLLIEFAYFGRLAKDEPNEITQNPMEYLRVGLEDYIDNDTCNPIQAVLAPLKEDSSSTPQGRRKARAPNVQVDNFRAINPIESNKSDIRKWNSRGSTLTQPMNIIRCITTLNQQLEKNQSIASDDIKARRERLRKGSFAAQEDLSFDFDARSSMLDIDEINAEIDTCPTKDEAFYGDEFYLSDNKQNLNKNKELILTKLRRKKKELQQRRKTDRQEVERRAQFEKKTFVLPPLSPLDTTKLQDSTKIHNTIKMPETLPTFEEFIKLLKDDEYYDPRYRNKVRLKSRMIAQRYYCNLQEDIKYSGLTKRFKQKRDTVININQTLNRDRKGLNGNGSKGKLRLPMVQESDRKLPKKPDDLNKVSTSSNQRFAEEVHGVTDSEPCKEHALKNKVSINRQREERPGRLRQNAQGKGFLKSQTDLAVSVQDVVNLKSLAEERSSTRLKSSQKSTSSEERCYPPPETSRFRSGKESTMFPKANICHDEICSPDTDTEESDSCDDVSCVFDSNKLNVRYSIERLRKKRRMKRKKPVMMDVLAKYYKVHASLKAFGKVSTLSEGSTGRDRLRRLGRLKKANSNPEEDRKLVIGKLRQFAFNGAKKAKNKMTFNSLSRGEFSKPDLSAFHADLRKAMDKFVVRREIVVSNSYTFKRAASSVTFTRKSCFHKKHVEA